MLLICNRYAAAQKLGSNVKVFDVVREITACKGLSLYVQAKFVVDTLNHFMASADENVTTAHVPTQMNHEKKGLIYIDHPMKMVAF